MLHGKNPTGKLSWEGVKLSTCGIIRLTFNIGQLQRCHWNGFLSRYLEEGASGKAKGVPGAKALGPSEFRAG